MSVDQDTLDFYNTIIDDVSTNAVREWVSHGGDTRILGQIIDLWRYRTLKKLGQDPGEEPTGFAQNATQNVQQEVGAIDFFDSLLRSSTTAKADEKVEETKAEEEDDTEEVEEFSDSSESESESDDGLGSDTDDEVDRAVSASDVTDYLIAYRLTSRKKKKRGRHEMQINLGYCHFTLNSVPRVIHGGTLKTEGK